MTRTDVFHNQPRKALVCVDLFINYAEYTRTRREACQAPQHGESIMLWNRIFKKIKDIKNEPIQYG